VTHPSGPGDAPPRPGPSDAGDGDGVGRGDGSFSTLPLSSSTDGRLDSTLDADGAIPQGAGRRDAAEPAPAPPLLTAEMLVPSGARRPARRDFEEGMRPLPPLTGALILLNMAAFAWQLGAGALESEAAIVAAGALRRAELLQGDVWRMLSSAFLHVDGGHLLGNMLALFIVGMAAEHALGPLRAAAVYLLSALGAAALSVAVHAGPSVGASGAVFGFMGAAAVFLWTHRRVYLLRDRRVAGVVALWAGYQLLTGFLDPWTDNAAHLGGLAAGVAATLLLARPPSGTERSPEVAAGV
jgi:rhomboid protease GluP